ncbi:hypothetical protein THAOC_07374 [Thalassiosira oceanica]|uniref:Uncharacterized protein n=1 Tax=Thalassiosira oceanica TaxID=159749 RepID=K0TKM2_THAOC|nr:hypothetical protein THAOC_07374 [Thalassiosira oceanica]|eukprot:EJK71207.1 hypothetical protein THAOC_07374 [Thalassiosira oceanica]
MGIGWMDGWMDGWMVTWPRGIPVLSNALFIHSSGRSVHSSGRSVSPVKSHPRLLQETIAPPPSPGSNQRVAPTKRGGNWSLAASSRPHIGRSKIGNRPTSSYTSSFDGYDH